MCHLVVGAELLSELERLSAPLDVVSHDGPLLVLLLDQEDRHSSLRPCKNLTVMIPHKMA